MRRRRTARTVMAVLLVVAGAGIMLYPRMTDLRYTLAQSVASAQAADGATAGGMPIPDGYVARMIIPKIALKAWVVEGTDAAALNRGPGHYEETPMPGESGNSAIAAHRTMYGHAFNRLDELEVGDRIETWTAQRRCTWRVVKVRSVKPRQVSVVAPTSKTCLTLTTCHPEGSARRRLVVTAELER